MPADSQAQVRESTRVLPEAGVRVPWHIRLTRSISASPALRSIRLDIMLAGAAVGIVLFGTYGYTMLLREKADLRTAVTREMRILGESLSVAVENAVRDGQLDDVREILASLDRQDSTVDVTVCDAAGKVLAKSAGVDEGGGQGDLVKSVLAGGEPELLYQREVEPARAILGVPLKDDGGRLIGALAIVRPLVDVQKDLAKTQQGVTLAVVLFVVAFAAIGWMTGTWFVRRPLEDIRETVASVREGSFESHIRVRRHDEIGELAGEFNQMIDALAEARRHRDEEIHARAQLEHGLAEVAKLATTGQLAASLAHEIGSPLQVMAGRARSLVDHPEDAGFTKRNAGILLEQCERIARIVEQLLHVGRRAPQRFTRFDLGPVVRSVVELLAMQAERSSLELRYRGPVVALPIDGNLDHVQQIVLNLVHNAMVATKAGGRIDVELAAAADGARLTVRDDGAGIAPEALEKVFEPFFTTRAERGGTGLGLTIVRAIVREHGGSVNIESTPGVGTAVTVELPSRVGAADLTEVRW
jgi:signal transduction histidine kinase